MEPSVEAMKAQLKSWSATIDDLADEMTRAGAQPGFDKVMKLDELKALRAIARTKLDEYEASGKEGRPHLLQAVHGAWSDIERALPKPRHRRHQKP